MKYKNLETPCIGICSTIYGDEVCRGCKRSSHEVITWNTLPLGQKDAILQRLENLTAEVTAKRLQVIDPELLKAKLKQTYVRFREEFSPECWAYNLLRVDADKISDISQYGIAIKAEYQNFKLRQLINDIDDELYQLSKQHLNAN